MRIKIRVVGGNGSNNCYRQSTDKLSATLFVMVVGVGLIFSTTLLAQAIPTLQVEIRGVAGAKLENIQARLRQQQKIVLQPLTAATVQQFYRDSPQEIVKALQPFGYFKPVIHSHLHHHKTDWQISYEVVLGEPVRISKIVLTFVGEGKNDSRLQRLRRQLPIQEGQIFSAQDYEQVKQRLFAWASERGYLQAALRHSEVRIDVAHNTAVILLDFDTGPRYSFGSVYFSPSPFHTGFLQRFLTFQPGEPYRNAKLQQLQSDLSNSSYFQQVVVIPHLAKAQNRQVPIRVQLKPRPAQHYNVGVGYGTDTGARASIGVKLRRVTATGQQFNSTINVSQIQQSIAASYLWPGRHPTTDSYQLNALTGQRDDNLGKSDFRKLSFDYSVLRRQGWLTGWQQTLSLSALNEHFQLRNAPSYTATLLVPSITLSRVRTDDPIRPSKAESFHFTLQGTPSIGHQHGFWQAVANAYWLRTLTPANRLLLRGSVAYTQVHDLTRLPLTYQQVAGGAESVRGYGYQTIGPGRSLVVGSAEWQHQIVGNWYAAAFLDAAQVNNPSQGGLKKGTGVGVVWLSPVGAMELTIAKALDAPGQPNRIQFVMGTRL